MLAPHKTGETTADFTGKRVLLAEDNALNAEIAVELLQSIGLKVDWAEDGQKAVEMFEKSAPGSYFAVFMDMQMPVMDGVEATRRIRASDRPDHDVPIFAMTANTFAADRKKCYDAGMSGYIPKPIDLETITHVLEEETGEYSKQAMRPAGMVGRIYFAISFWEKHLRPLIQLNNSISGYKNYISKLYLTTY